MGQFVDLVRQSKIRHPTQRGFQPAKWTKDYGRVGSADAADERLHRAGLWLFDRLSSVRAIFSQVSPIRRPRHAQLRLYVGLCNRLVNDAVRAAHDRVAALVAAMREGRAEERSAAPIPVLRPDTELADTAEGLVDALRFPLARIARGEPLLGSDNPNTDRAVLESLWADLHVAHTYDVLETLWQSFLWSEWYIEEGPAASLITPSNADTAFDHAVGLYRRDHLLLETSTRARFMWKRAPAYERRVIASRHRITDIVREGRHKRLRTGPLTTVPAEIPEDEITRLTAEELYFNPLLVRPLPDLYGLSVRQLLECWSSLAPLATLIRERYPRVNDITTVNTLVAYGPTFSKEELVGALQRCQGLPRHVAAAVIDLLTFAGDHRDDLWRRPFVAVGDGQLAVLVPALSNPNLIRSIEFWLREGRMGLAERGDLFEEYIRADLCRYNALEVATIVAHPVTFAVGGASEELDIVIRLGSTLLLGEAKCSVQPTGPVDFFNHYADLDDGATQVARKAAFVERYLAEFLSGLGWSAGDAWTVLPLVVTNVPFGAATLRHGVPIVDHLILHRYFAQPWVDQYGIIDPQKGHLPGKRIRFYTDQASAERNVAEYLRAPPQLRPYWDHVRPQKHPFFKFAEDEKPTVLVNFEVVLPDLMPIGGAEEQPESGAIQ